MTGSVIRSFMLDTPSCAGWVDAASSTLPVSGLRQLPGPLARTQGHSSATSVVQHALVVDTGSLYLEITLCSYRSQTTTVISSGW